MGFYQLSRLYHCFSREKTYSNTGYPFVFYPWFLYSIPTKCYINKEYVFILDGDEAIIDDNGTLHYRWEEILAAAFGIWDTFTFLLYIFKVLSINRYKKVNPMVYKRITSILWKVTILTALYMLGAVFLFIIGLSNNESILDILLPLSFALSSISLSYSIYLMQSHNEAVYERFLAITFCCHSFVSKELLFVKTMEIDNAEDNNGMKPGMNKMKTMDTLYETHDISKDHERVKCVEVSVETTMLQ